MKNSSNYFTFEDCGYIGYIEKIKKENVGFSDANFYKLSSALPIRAKDALIYAIEPTQIFLIIKSEDDNEYEIPKTIQHKFMIYMKSYLTLYFNINTFSYVRLKNSQFSTYKLSNFYQKTGRQLNVTERATFNYPIFMKDQLSLIEILIKSGFDLHDIIPDKLWMIRLVQNILNYPQEEEGVSTEEELNDDSTINLELVPIDELASTDIPIENKKKRKRNKKKKDEIGRTDVRCDVLQLSSNQPIDETNEKEVPCEGNQDIDINKKIEEDGSATIIPNKSESIKSEASSSVDKIVKGKKFIQDPTNNPNIGRSFRRPYKKKKAIPPSQESIEKERDLKLFIEVLATNACTNRSERRNHESNKGRFIKGVKNLVHNKVAR